jgi:hypothetical protein
MVRHNRLTFGIFVCSPCFVLYGIVLVLKRFSAVCVLGAFLDPVHYMIQICGSNLQGEVRRRGFCPLWEHTR